MPPEKLVDPGCVSSLWWAVMIVMGKDLQVIGVVVVD
jgi:hypothetical protein